MGSEINLDYWARQLSDGDHPLIATVRELRAENARLQAEHEAQMRGAESGAKELRKELCAARKENARLREAMTAAINCKAMPRLDGRDWCIVLRDALKGGG